MIIITRFRVQNGFDFCSSISAKTSHINKYSSQSVCVSTQKTEGLSQKDNLRNQANKLPVEFSTTNLSSWVFRNYVSDVVQIQEIRHYFLKAV